MAAGEDSEAEWERSGVLIARAQEWGGAERRQASWARSCSQVASLVLLPVSGRGWEVRAQARQVSRSKGRRGRLDGELELLAEPSS